MEALFAQDQNLAILLAVTTLLVTASTLEIKNLLREQVEGDIRRVLNVIPRKWRPRATLRVDKLAADLREWAEGRRPISRDRSVSYQVQLLTSANTSVDAIHLAVPVDKLDRWLVPRSQFGNLVAAHKSLPAGVTKRRILFLDDSDDLLDQSDEPRFSNEKVIKFCNEQVSELGVQLRVLFLSDLEGDDSEKPPDLLLVDAREAVVVTNIVDAAGKEHFDTMAYLGEARVLDYAATFEDSWYMAQPVERFLPGVQTE